MRISLFIFLLVASNTTFGVDLSRAFFSGGLSSVTNSVSNDFEITADGSQVVFTADFDNDDFFELYAINIDGSSPRRLDTSASNANFKIEDSDDFDVSPNGKFVIFKAENPDTNDKRPYAVDLIVPNPVAKNIFPPSNMLVSDLFDKFRFFQYFISDDSERIVMTLGNAIFRQIIIDGVVVDTRLDSDQRFFSLKIPNGNLSNSSANNEYVNFYSHSTGIFPELSFTAHFTKDSRHFLASIPHEDNYELFRLDVDTVSTSPQRLSSSGGNSVFFGDSSQDGSALLYVQSRYTREEREENENLPNINDLYITRLDTLNSIQLTSQFSNANNALVGFNLPGISSFSFDSNYVTFFTGDIEAVNSQFLFGQATKHFVQNPFNPPSGLVDRSFVTNDAFIADIGTSLETGDLFYLAQRPFTTEIKLYNGENEVDFIPDTPEFRQIKKHDHSSDGKVTVFTASSSSTIFDETGLNTDQSYVYDARTEPAQLTKITNNTGPSNPLFLNNAFLLSPNGEVIITAVPDISELSFTSGFIDDFFAFKLGAKESIRVTPNLTPGGHLWLHKFTPDSKTLVYLADRDKDGLTELYTLDIEAALTEPEERSADFCFPIKSKNGSVAVVCL